MVQDNTDNNHEEPPTELRIGEKDGLLLPLFFHLFQFLKKISIFSFCRFLARKLSRGGKISAFFKGHLFPEVWLLLNLTLAITGSLLIGFIDAPALYATLFIYALLRSASIFIYQINVLLFDRLACHGQPYRLKSATRSIIALILNMTEYIFWFTLMYQIASKMLLGTELSGTSGLITSFSVFMNLNLLSQTLLKSNWLMLFAFLESSAGILLNIICIARFLAFLPKVDTIEPN